MGPGYSTSLTYSEASHEATADCGCTRHFANNLGQKFERSHGYPGRRISWVRGVGSVGGGGEWPPQRHYSQPATIASWCVTQPATCSNYPQAMRSLAKRRVIEQRSRRHPSWHCSVPCVTCVIEQAARQFFVERIADAIDEPRAAPRLWKLRVSVSGTGPLTRSWRQVSMSCDHGQRRQGCAAPEDLALMPAHDRGGG
jgi:hypothetical protein